MARNVFKLGFLPIVSDLYSPDTVERSTKTEQLTDTKSPTETGWDRLKRMFTVDEFGNVTTEANTILQAASMGAFIGAIYGGTSYGRKAYESFLRNNDATTFRTHLEAKSKLQEAVYIAFGKGALRWGWRLSLFSSSFLGIVTMMQVYREKYGILEYICAGGATGAMYKFNMGPRGWIAGAALGSLLGVVSGGITVGLLKASGMSMEEARYWQYKWKDTRTEYFKKGVKEYFEKEDFPVVKLHNDEVGESGKSLDNLDKDTESKPN